jgi:uncharacterized OsmC-like protein
MTDKSQTSLTGSHERHVLRCRTVGSGSLDQLNYVRDLAPLSVGERFGPPGDASVTSPSEALLIALGSCLSAHIHANAALGNIVVNSLELDVEADVSPSPIWNRPGDAPGPIGIEAIRVAVRMDATASTEALRLLVARAVLWSPVANTLHGPVHLDVAVNSSSTAAVDPPSA